MSKGSNRRPSQVSAQEEAANWQRTFPPPPRMLGRQIRLRKIVGSTEMTDEFRVHLGMSDEDMREAGYEWAETRSGMGFEVWRKVVDEVREL